MKNLLNYNAPIPKGDRQKYEFDFGTSSEISGEEKGENGQYTITVSYTHLTLPTTSRV